jgi:lipid-A-disaccharide synthase
VAYYGSPMIVMYKASRLMYHLFARHTMQIKHYSLVNILAGRSVVPEFMPYYNSTAPIAACAIDLFASDEKRQQMRRQIRETIETIRQPGASARTAGILLALADGSVA